jgi:hypothetical protein
MSRKKGLIRPVVKQLSLPEDLCLKVDLELWSEVEGRVPYAAWKGLVEELLREWLKVRGAGNNSARVSEGR